MKALKKDPETLRVVVLFIVVIAVTLFVGLYFKPFTYSSKDKIEVNFNNAKQNLEDWNNG